MLNRHGSHAGCWPAVRLWPAFTATHYDGTCARARRFGVLCLRLAGCRARATSRPLAASLIGAHELPHVVSLLVERFEVASSARRRLAAGGARSLFIAALNPASLRSCPLPSRRSMPRASPLEKSSAMLRNRRSWIGWPSSKRSSPSVGLRASHPHSAGSSHRASPSRSRAFTSLETSVAARPC
jgi:hypothetical protein